MSEIKILVDELGMNYEGLFSLKDLYKIIDEYSHQKSYDKQEKENTEQVTPHGKHVHMILEPIKLVSDYFALIMKIELDVRDMKEVETTIDKKKVRLNQGIVKIKYSAIIKSDWEGRWKDKPIYYFLRTLYDKYIYRQQTKNFEKQLTDDLMHLKEQVGSFLNLHKFRKAD